MISELNNKTGHCDITGIDYRLIAHKITKKAIVILGDNKLVTSFCNKIWEAFEFEDELGVFAKIENEKYIYNAGDENFGEINV